MATNDIIEVPKLDADEHTKQWFKLEGGPQFKNIGFIAEVGYSETVGVEPSGLSGETLMPGSVTEDDRGDAYVLQDSYFSYKFSVVGDITYSTANTWTT
ncbi:MAG: hypothetical protein ABXS91_08690 [Sulfurimonas sp.]